MSLPERPVAATAMTWLAGKAAGYSGCASRSCPLLPAATVMITPASLAAWTASSNAWLRPGPDTDMLMIFAPLATA